LTDLVPGRLTVIRLLDPSEDLAGVPYTKAEGEFECNESQTGICNEQFTLGSDAWDALRRNQSGALERPRRGDPEFKERLNAHLEQKSADSQFYTSFLAAQGVFAAHAEDGFRSSKRVILWLSDGKDENELLLAPVLTELRNDGVEIVAVVFGKEGDPRIPKENGLDVAEVADPIKLMGAFADVFRNLVGAPFQIDNSVGESPTFQMHENVDEAWIVVYGDETLAEVKVSGPDGERIANFAEDRYAPAGRPAAGAYRVARLIEPSAGLWRVQIEGGGSDAAYAVVQRSSLAPYLLEPRSTATDTKVRIVAGIRAKRSGQLIDAPAVLAGAVIDIDVEGGTVRLRDDGQDADEDAGDGRFSAWYRFRGTGAIPVTMRLDSPLVQRAAKDEIQVEGVFRYRGKPIDLDFGELLAPETTCLPLPELDAEHKGTLPFELALLKRPPHDHRFYIEAGGRVLPTGGATLPMAEGLALRLCFESGERAPHSSADGEPWLVLKPVGSEDPQQAVTLRLSWTLEGLSFWELWFWWLLALLLILLAIVIALGFILPVRLPRTLALTFVPELGDIDDNPPMAVNHWPGVRIGFYRNARAYLHSGFRVSGRGRGALAGLVATPGSVMVVPGKGMALQRRRDDGVWDRIKQQGETARFGPVYRIGEGGPFFRIAQRIGK